MGFGTGSEGVSKLWDGAFSSSMGSSTEKARLETHFGSSNPQPGSGDGVVSFCFTRLQSYQASPRDSFDVREF